MPVFREHSIDGELLNELIDSILENAEHQKCASSKNCFEEAKMETKYACGGFKLKTY